MNKLELIKRSVRTMDFKYNNNIRGLIHDLKKEFERIWLYDAEVSGTFIDLLYKVLYNINIDLYNELYTTIDILLTNKKYKEAYNILINLSNRCFHISVLN